MSGQHIFYLGSCIVLYGLAMLTMKYVSHHLDPLTTIVLNTLGYVLIAAFVCPSFKMGAWLPSLAAVSIGVMYIVGNLAFYKLSRSAEVSTIVPLTALHIVIPVIGGLVFFSEHFDVKKGAGLVCALLSVYLLSASEG